MNNGGEAAEMIVRLYLEGFEEVVKLTGTGIKNLVPLLATTLKQESKTKGKERLSKMIKSGSPLKVFTFKNKDLKKFTEQAKRYGVLYTVLRDKNSNDPNATVDVIARAEDASKFNVSLTALNSLRLTRLLSLRKLRKRKPNGGRYRSKSPSSPKKILLSRKRWHLLPRRRRMPTKPPDAAKTVTKNPPPSRHSSGAHDTKADKGNSQVRRQKAFP